MNINRNNYEEFFLLYVDKELSAAERKAVELFVQENPDLKAELLLLQDSILPSEHFSFDKSSLLKTDDFAALQEKLVLYGDNELSKEEAAGIKALLQKDKAAATEWNILQSARLQPELVVFEDKASLYRKEEGRVVAFKWWRVAAAAILLGLGTWTGISIYNKNSISIKGEEVARGNNPVKKNDNPSNTVLAGTQPTATDNSNPENSNDVASSNNNTINNVTADPHKTRVVDHNNKNTVVPNPVQRTVVKDNNVLVNNNDQDNNKQQQQPSNNLPKPYFENINKRESNTIALVNVPPVEDNNKSGTVTASANPKKSVEDINSNPTTNPYAKLASADENMNYLEEDKNKKTKLGGFFRKVRRVLERSANIKTGEGIQIAGFEIAAK